VIERKDRTMAKEKAKKKLVPFDNLKLIAKTEQGSGWQGEKGYYYFKPMDKEGPTQPIRQVYLNRKYFTGLFKTKKKGVFFGDMKVEDGKKYLQFQLLGGNGIKIFEKVQI
jgi:hypothetical protein